MIVATTIERIDPMHMQPRNRIRLLGVAVCLCVMSLAACGGSSSKGSSSSAGTTSGGSSSGSTPAAATSSSGGGSATCKQITKADVQPLLTAPITSVTVTAAGTGPNLQPDGKGQKCVFALADTSSAITITVLPSDDSMRNYAGDLAALTSSAVSVPGIGDKAVRDGSHGSTTLSSQKGNVYCAVDVSDAGDVPGVGQLEHAAGDTSNIPDSAYAELAAAIGTLCNRVYGSGNTTPDLTALVAAGKAAAAQPTVTTGLPTGLEP